MGKNILIFSDGTGQAGGVRPDQRLSSIYKLYRATRTGPDSSIDPAVQVAFYGAGLGTENVDPPFGWSINNRTFEMDEVLPDEVVRLGALEAWDIENTSGGFHGGGMAHPIHLHGFQFRAPGRSPLRIRLALRLRRLRRRGMEGHGSRDAWRTGARIGEIR